MMEERLRYLFKQYIDNICTHKELEEFFGYIRAAEHDDTIRQCIRNAYTEIENSDSLSTHVDEKGRLILTEPTWIATNIKPEKKSGNRWISKVSLAAFVILMAGSIWVVNHRAGLGKRQTDLAAFTKKNLLIVQNLNTSCCPIVLKYGLMPLVRYSSLINLMVCPSTSSK